MLRTVLLAALLILLVPGLQSRLADSLLLLGKTETQPGQEEMHALAAAWPSRIVETAWRDGDWMLRIDDTWFAWAEGRILPEADRSQWQSYEPMSFSQYPLDLPPLAELDNQAAALLRQQVKEELARPPRRSEAFLGLLLHSDSRAATEARLVKMEVAGFTVTVHEEVKEPLARVSEELRGLRESDPVVAAFLRGLTEMNGYNYRYVDGTRTRSLHSYGLAVDLIPRTFHLKTTYWLWAMNHTADWWTIPYEQRWMPPMGVVEAFERQGFVWGGKWLFFDTMHFEYRPEVLALAKARAPGAAEIPQP